MPASLRNPLVPLCGAAAALALATAPAAWAAEPAAGAPAPAASSVEVRYLEPDSFADIGRTPWDRERVLKAMTAHLQKLGTTLPAGQKLNVEVTDIDLAGDIRPWGWHELRVLRGQADWPQMTLRYTLAEGERTLKSGEVRLSDLSYMQNLRARDRAGDELGFEKRMVKRWFEDTFTTP